MKPEIVSLHSQIAQLRRQVMANRVPARRQMAIPAPPVQPVEWVVRSAEGGTYTAGTDWGPNFDGINTATTAYLDARHPAGGGWVHVGSNSGARGFRARLVFDSDSSFEARLGINMDSGRVQIQDNGRIQEYTANDIAVLQFFKGRNCLDCMCNEDCVEARFRLTAIDAILTKGVRQVIQ